VIARAGKIPLTNARALWVVSAVGVLLLGIYASSAGSPGWEVAVVRFIQDLSVPGLRELDLLFTRVGHTPWALPLTGLAILGLAALGHPRLGLLLAVATGGRIIGGVVKVLVDRPRPDGGDVDLAQLFGGPSFPSGHVLGTTLLLGWLAYSAIHVIPHRGARLSFQTVCVAAVALMGLSRVELGAHWPTDVVGGYLVAALMLIPLMSLNSRLHLLSEPRRAETEAVVTARGDADDACGTHRDFGDEENVPTDAGDRQMDERRTA
jgi:undecaprenyl-diphosphatase